MIRSEVMNVDALFCYRSALQHHGAIGVNVHNWKGSHCVGLQFVGLISELQDLLSGLIVVQDVMMIGNQQIVVDEHLMLLLQQVQVCYEWNVQ